MLNVRGPISVTRAVDDTASHALARRLRPAPAESGFSEATASVSSTTALIWSCSPSKRQRVWPALCLRRQLSLHDFYQSRGLHLAESRTDTHACRLRHWDQISIRRSVDQAVFDLDPDNRCEASEFCNRLPALRTARPRSSTTRRIGSSPIEPSHQGLGRSPR